MPKSDYSAEEAWLSEYFEFCDYLDLSTEVQTEMIAEGITLSDITDVLRDPTIIFYEREREGCCVIVQGRNCDGERIEIHGGFSSEMMYVSVSKVAKVR